MNLFKVVIATLLAITSAVASSNRLDPHGPTKSEACTFCHRASSEGAAGLDSPSKVLRSFKESCSNCHNSQPHSGVVEHMGKRFFNQTSRERGRMDCLSCHAPHRKGTEGTGGWAAHESKSLLRSQCGDCHIPKTKRLDHRLHAEVFQRAFGDCTSCHSFAIKSQGFDPLAQNVEGASIKANPETCKKCHGVGAKFQHEWLSGESSKVCMSCHKDRAIHHRSTEVARARGAPTELVCRTCHFAEGGKPKTLQLCASCHGAKAKSLYERIHQIRGRGVGP